MIVACMGGWCQQRNKCAHYHSASRSISERLCAPGVEAPEQMESAKTRPAESLQHQLKKEKA